MDSCLRAGLAAPAVARAFMDGGARILQIRAKTLPSGAFLTLCDNTVRLAEPYAATVIVNDRADLAVMAGAAGVHVGQDDLDVASVRRILPAGAIVGRSTHTVEQFDDALREPVSYVAVGPVFGTRSKSSGYTPIGVEFVRQAVARAGGRPVVAIGGITRDTAPDVIAAGAAAVAIIGDLLSTGDPAGRVREVLAALR